MVLHISLIKYVYLTHKVMAFPLNFHNVLLFQLFSCILNISLKNHALSMSLNAALFSTANFVSVIFSSANDSDTEYIRLMVNATVCAVLKDTKCSAVS